jgi:hypothetical protein
MGQFHQHVYAKLLRAQIPKVQKNYGLAVFFALLGSARVKAACKESVKSN